MQERLAATRAAATAAAEAETAAVVERDARRGRLETTEAERTAATERASASSATVAALRGRVEALAARLDDDERRPIARAAKRLGGRRIDDDLVVDPGLRAAVEAALADAARAYLVPGGAVGELAGGTRATRHRGTVDGGSGWQPAAAAERRLLDAVGTAGGGSLAEAVRRDTTGAVRRALGRAVWVPDLAAALALQPVLPSGWVAVPRDGQAVVDELGVSLGASESLLERRAEHARLGADLDRASATLDALQEATTAADAAAVTARSALEAARADEGRVAGDRRRAEEAERAVAREAEAVEREAAWHSAQRERLTAEVDHLARGRPGRADAGPVRIRCPGRRRR